MRCGYSDDVYDKELNMWRGQVASALRGKRGQYLLRTLAEALDEMPEKRLIKDKLIDGNDVCLLGAGGRAMQIRLEGIDPEDHDKLAEIFNVASCLIKEIEYVNDDAGQRQETPEERFVRVRGWIDKSVK